MPNFYEIRTVRPVPYPSPADGPVGMLLCETDFVLRRAGAS